MAANRCRVLLFIFLALLSGNTFAEKKYTVGVYYFPGWSSYEYGGKKSPWQNIQSYGEREPLLGWYEEGQVSVAEQQIAWMNHYGINVIVYDWYSSVNGVPFRTQAIDAYLLASNHQSIKFALLWVNQPGNPSSLAAFDQMIDYWVERYFRHPQYWRIDGKPVVLIYKSDGLRKDAKAIQVTAGDLLKRIVDRVAGVGVKGVFFVGSTPASTTDMTLTLPEEGYDAITAYNYHGGPDSYRKNQGWSQSYLELITGYEQQWELYVKNANLPYFLPLTSGWDKRPLGGSADKGHDNSYGDPVLFGKHLQSARNLVDALPERTNKTVLVCCWNEFGEGSYIEPTKGQGFHFLEQIKNVFGGK